MTENCWILLNLLNFVLWSISTNTSFMTSLKKKNMTFKLCKWRTLSVSVVEHFWCGVKIGWNHAGTYPPVTLFVSLCPSDSIPSPDLSSLGNGGILVIRIKITEDTTWSRYPKSCWKLPMPGTPARCQYRGLFTPSRLQYVPLSRTSTVLCLAVACWNYSWICRFVRLQAWASLVGRARATKHVADGGAGNGHKVAIFQSAASLRDQKNLKTIACTTRITVQSPMLFIRSLSSIMVATCFLTSISAYAGHADGIMRGNRPLGLSNSKHDNASPNDKKRHAVLSANPVSGTSNHGAKSARLCHPASHQATYFEEMWGQVPTKIQVRYQSINSGHQFEN